MKNILLLSVFWIVFSSLNAQITVYDVPVGRDSLIDSVLVAESFRSSPDTTKRYEKWGHVSSADREMMVYPLDSAAPAVILHDVGYTHVENTNKGWLVLQHHLRRIKVFETSAFDQGNLSIPFLSGSNEKVVNLQIQLILPDSTIQPVKADNVFTGQMSKRYSVIKVFVPNLKKGCIIEYQYDIVSGGIFSLPDWYFHQELPVRWSEISLMHPSMFEYAFLAEGPRDFDVSEKRRPAPGLSFVRLGLADMPALKEEPYITTLDDYRAHARFQLSKVGGVIISATEVMSTWPALANTLAEDKRFGNSYIKSAGIKSLWGDFKPLLNKTDAPEEIAEKALRFVSGNIRWDETYRLFVDKNLKDVFNKKSGSSAELNLAVVGLLQKADLDAVPVLVSTRSNGAVYKAYPFVQQFNSVVALLRLGNKNILLDATDPLHALNQLQSEHYNGSGWVVDPKNPVWIDIKPIELAATWYGDLILNELGEIDGAFDMVASGPLATEWRKALEGSRRDDFLKDHFATEYQEARFDSLIVSNEQALEQPLKLRFKCHIANTANVINDFIYFKPVLDFMLSENPFKSLKRDLPINLGYPMKAQYVANITLPPGYKIEEMPKSARILLGENAGRLQFSCDKASDMRFQLYLKASISETEFRKEEYEALRSFFGLMIEKSSVQLVLKKE